MIDIKNFMNQRQKRLWNIMDWMNPVDGLLTGVRFRGQAAAGRKLRSFHT